MNTFTKFLSYIEKSVMKGLIQFINLLFKFSTVTSRDLYNIRLKKELLPYMALR